MKKNQNPSKRPKRGSSAETHSGENQNKNKSTGHKRGNNRTPQSHRTRVEQAKRSLPQSPKSWADTISHVIATSTPRHLSHLIEEDGVTNTILDETLEINK